MQSAKRIIDYDHYSPEHARDAVEEERQLRTECPIAWSERYGGFWVLANYEAVTTTLRNHEIFSSAKVFDDHGEPHGGLSIPTSRGFRLVPDETDPPEWNRYRKLLNPLFSPVAVERLEPMVRSLTTTVINQVIESGEVDLILDIVNPLTALVTLQLLGLPLQGWHLFADTIHEITYSPQGTPEYERALAGLATIHERFGEAIADHRKHPSDDIIGYLIKADIDGAPLEDSVLHDLCHQILAGGVDTTTSLLGSAFVYLDDRQNERRWLLEDPMLMRTATEEFLRAFSPLPSIARTVTRETEIAGQRVCPGERVLALYGSANRDETVFEDADRIKLDRFPNPHAGFGIGIHRCLGSHLARLMFRTVLAQTLERMPDYRIRRGAAERYPSIGLINGWIRMPANFTPGPQLQPHLKFTI